MKKLKNCIIEYEANGTEGKVMRGEEEVFIFNSLFELELWINAQNPYHGPNPLPY